MPKFPKSFGRRKSVANAFEDVQGSSTVEPNSSISSFKVFERPDVASNTFDGGVKLAKAAGSHLNSNNTSKTAHRPDNMFEDIINGNRGSGASNTNTASTTDNSSRLSAASTAPSSTDTKNEEWKAPSDKPVHGIPVPPIPKSQTGFSLKAAGRSLSWGRNHKSSTPPPPISKSPLPTPPLDDHQSRARAVTSSSYASTATPPKIEERELGLSLGGDFGDMFGGFGKRKSALLEAANSKAKAQNYETTPPGSATKRFNQPTHLTIDRTLQVEPSPYSWSSQHSHDGLISGSSPPAFAPRNDSTPSPPPVPQHSSPPRNNVSSPPRTRRPGALADTGLRRNSAYSGRRQSTLDIEPMDEDARLLREAIAASRRLDEPSYSPDVRSSWQIPPGSKVNVESGNVGSWPTGADETTPKPKKAQALVRSESMFDDQIVETANLAQRFADSQLSPPKKQGPPQTKVMTPAQFERYKQDQERLRGAGGQAKEEDEDEDEAYDDESDDEVEKQKELAKQRRKQEAHMAVYRQQMMKVTGETSTPGVLTANGGSAARPGIFGTQSTPNLNLGIPEEGEEEDEEVPLAILQAHGFPNKGKPPMRTHGSNPNLRAPTAAGGGNLPVFARHLPEDPYYGAGLQTPMHRESMAFAGGTNSANGGSPRGVPPGGLVGVIATEERSRAMRRGSPNANCGFGPPSGGFDGMGMQGSPSMMNMAQMGGMSPMMMQTDPAQAHMNQQMQQMQQFMQVQMHFMQMMSQGQQSQAAGPVSIPQQDFMRPGSAQGGAPQLRPQSSHQRAMTMIDPNAAPWMQQGGGYAPSMSGGMGLGGYAPSIAPSERSNIGLPGRYRPVSHAPPMEKKSRASSISGALQGWENKNMQSTIKAVPRKSANVSDDDDDEGWEQMKKAKEKKKSMWRTKKSHNDVKDVLAAYAQ